MKEIITREEVLNLKKKKGLSNPDISKLTGLSKRTICGVLTGKYPKEASKNHLETIYKAMKTRAIQNKIFSIYKKRRAKEILKMIELNQDVLNLFGLKDQPFSSGHVGVHVWKNPKIASVIERIKQSTIKPAFILFTGGVGVGKSTILQTALSEIRMKLSKSVKLIYIRPTHVEKINARYITNYIVKEITGQKAPQNYELKADAAADAINSVKKNGKRIAIVIDEAQRLEPDALRSIKRYQEGLGTHEGSVSFILIGHLDIMRTLEREDITEVTKRLVIENIEPFHINGEKSTEEIDSYIQYKLEKQGYPKEKKVFTPDAIAEIANRCDSILDVNVLSTLCLQKAASIGEIIITDEIVNQVW